MCPLSPARVLPRWMVVFGASVSLILFSSHVPAFESFTTTVSCYDGVNLSTATTEVDPTVLTLVIGSALEVEQIAAPEIDPLFHFSPSVHVSFGLTAHPAQPVMLQPQANVAFAIVEQTDPASLTDAQLARLDYATQPVAVAPNQFVVANLGDGVYRILGQIAPNPDATVQFTVWTPEIGSMPTVTPTPPVSEPTATPTPPVSVPEPGTFALLVVGVLLLCRGKFWKKHCVKGGISMKQARVMVLFVGLLVGLSNSGWAAEVMVVKIGTGEGIVDGGDDIFCGASCEATYEKGTVVQLKAVPDDDAKFDGWLVNGKPHEGTLVVDDENILVAAKFTSTIPPTNELKWMWYNGNEKQYLLFALDEIAVFPKDMPDDWYAFTGEFKATVEEIAHLFHPQAEVSELNDFCITIKSPESVTLKELPGLLERIAQHPFLRSAGPVLYGSPGNPYTEMIPDGSISVGYPLHYTDVQIHQIEDEYGLVRSDPETIFDGRPIFYAVEMPWTSLELANHLFESGLVRYAHPGWISAAILLNSTTGSSPLKESEAVNDFWHFQEPAQHGANILNAWNILKKMAQNTSSEVVVAIVDDGIEINHPDLRQNIENTLCYNFVTDNVKEDPSPTIQIDSLPKDASKIQLNGGHGTCCAGIVAAIQGNADLGVYGIAPNVKIVGFRDAGMRADSKTGSLNPVRTRPNSDFEKLYKYNENIQIYNNSWSRLMFHPLASDEIDALAWGTNGKNEKHKGSGRHGLGSIFVFGAGNERNERDNEKGEKELFASGDSNFNAFANSRYVIAVAAATNTGKYAPYSSPGANILVNAPCDPIPTTDRMGKEGYNPWGYNEFEHQPVEGEYQDQDYTRYFKGTSAAAPVVSGVIALMLQANPALTWRDVQQILIKTAYKNPDGEWKRNAAGYSHSYDYGFGRVDAAAAVEAALSWETVPEEREKPVFGKDYKKRQIPEGGEGLPIPLSIKENITVEFVELILDVQHPEHVCDLEVMLISPYGTKSRLAHGNGCYYSDVSANAKGYGFKNWRFGSVRYFGEQSTKGQNPWELIIKDKNNDHTQGIFKSAELRIYGTNTPPGLPFTGVYGLKNDQELEWMPQTIPTSDGGFLTVVTVYATEKLLVMKLDSAGGVEWANTLIGNADATPSLATVGTYRASEAALTAFSQAGFADAAAALRNALGSQTYASPSLFTHLSRRAVLPPQSPFSARPRTRRSKMRRRPSPSRLISVCVSCNGAQYVVIRQSCQRPSRCLTALPITFCVNTSTG